MAYTFDAINLLRKREDVVPSHIPDDAIIFNAPRPLFGECWTGDFCCGTFYTAVLPDDPNRELWIKENKSLAATILLFIDDDKAREMVRQYLIDNGYGEIESDLFDEIWRDTFHDAFACTTVEIV